MLRVLVADDDDRFRLEAVRLFADLRPDVVPMGVVMPPCDASMPQGGSSKSSRPSA
jgi:hypothetical protein